MEEKNRAERFILYIQSAFDTHSAGASARKLSAFWIIMLITALHLSYFRYQYTKDGEYKLLIEILIIDYCFVALALGLTTIETIMKLKNGNTQRETLTIETTKTQPQNEIQTPSQPI